MLEKFLMVSVMILIAFSITASPVESAKTGCCIYVGWDIIPPNDVHVDDDHCFWCSDCIDICGTSNWCCWLALAYINDCPYAARYSKWTVLDETDGICPLDPPDYTYYGRGDCGEKVTITIERSYIIHEDCFDPLHPEDSFTLGWCEPLTACTCAVPWDDCLDEALGDIYWIPDLPGWEVTVKPSIVYSCTCN